MSFAADVTVIVIEIEINKNERNPLYDVAFTVNYNVSLYRKKKSAIKTKRLSNRMAHIRHSYTPYTMYNMYKLS